MQSYLAYKRFGKRVRTQYERDLKKAEILHRANVQLRNEDIVPQSNGHRPSSMASSASSTIRRELDTTNTRDAEKAEQSYPPEPFDLREGPGGCQEDGVPVARIHTAQTDGSFGARLGNIMTGVEVRTMTKEISRTLSRRSRQTGGDIENTEPRDKVFVVGYESENDDLNPHNWSYVQRIRCTFLIALIGFIVGFASSVDSAAITQAAANLHVSEVAESLATGLFLIGFGSGALLAGPISETVGRNPVYIVTLFVYMIWIMASALAPNFAAQIIFRFLAGFFGATPLVCAGGSISDLWNPMERVYAFPVFANAAFLGPIFGPVVGGFIGQSSLVSWRWTEWITLVLSGAILVLIVLLQPETFAPILLKWKAKHLRRVTGDKRYVAEVELRAESFWKRLIHALYRPFLLTFREPIVILFALYLTVIYIILFTFLDGYNYIFGEMYGFSEGITGLAFIGIAVGLCCASLLVPVIHYMAKEKLRLVKLHGGNRLPPEQRLWFAMFGAPAVPISLFWMGWTANPAISYWSPLIASVLFGYGILTIFISSYQYIIDSYELYAASALASLTFIRYVAAGGMTIVGVPFYQNIGVPYTLTILGSISAAMVPVPYLFYIYGPKIRSYSRYAAVI